MNGKTQMPIFAGIELENHQRLNSAIIQKLSTMHAITTGVTLKADKIWNLTTNNGTIFIINDSDQEEEEEDDIVKNKKLSVLGKRKQMSLSDHENDNNHNINEPPHKKQKFI
eukprot:311001_1